MSTCVGMSSPFDASTTGGSAPGACSVVAGALAGVGPVAGSVDLDRLVAASEFFTPADIEFAARKGAQAAFEREMATRAADRATTEDFLAAIGEVRPTLTAAMLDEFRSDSGLYARL